MTSLGIMELMDLSHLIEMPFNIFYNYVWYIVPFCFFTYCIVDALMTRQLLQKSEYPLVGSHFMLVPRFILNLQYALKATELAKQGYDKVGNGGGCLY